MAIAEETGWEVLESDKTAISGEYIVEEREVEGRDDAVMRRLIFFQNQHFVQTEARLVCRKPGLSGKVKGKSKAKGKNKTREKGKEKEKEKEKVIDVAFEDVQAIDDFEFDLSYLDDHHRCFLVRM